MTIESMKRGGLLLGLGLLVAIFYQNCSPIGFDSSSAKSSKLILDSYGNGGAYEGKLTVYNAYDSTQPCLEVGADSNPLPNHQIHQTPVSLKLVRENCSDLSVPKALSPSEVSGLDSNSGQITYAGILFSEQPIANDFDVIAASCPAGMTLKSNAVRNNLILAGLNLFDGVWDQSNGVTVAMTGALGGLPRFHITRQSNGLEWYKRPQQAVNLVSGAYYSFTFLARKENVQEVLVSGYFQNDTSLEVYFNLDTGVGRDVGSLGMSNVSFASRPFSGGYIVTVFFTSPLSAPMYLGVTPGPSLPGASLRDEYPDGQAGDSVAITALQLEEVSQYCNP